MRARIIVTVLAIATGLAALAPAAAAAPAAGPQWRIQPTPLPSYGDAGSWTDGTLSAVSCPTEPFCIALGGGDFQAPDLLQGQWNGSRWNLKGVDAASVHSQGFSVGTGGVSCVAANACYAVVESGNADTNSFAFGLVWNGHRWRLVDIPGELNPNSDLLSAISCSSTRFCMAVGQIGSRLYTVAWNGSKWRVVPVAKSRVQQLIGVSCPAAGSCFAVGASPGGGRLGLIEHWNGRSWMVQPTPVAARARQIVLSSVSCSARNACVAVGNYRDRARKNQVFALRWDGRGWHRMTFARTSGTLSSVSCLASGWCMAVGSAPGSWVARTWNGTRWRLQPLPMAGAYSVSCVTTTYCMATGVAGGGTPLAMLYS